MPARKTKPATKAKTPKKMVKKEIRSDFPIATVMEILRKETKKLRVPIVTVQAQTKKDPFRVLISTIISLRTKDEVTAQASERLYALADTPQGILKLGERTIAETIYPAGFYKTKAANIIKVCQLLLDEYDGKVPSEIEQLVAFPGVGRKTANLVRTLGYNLPGICVDTHVHRITNRWGYVNTPNPDKTEMALREILPKKYWIPINDWLVAYGQHLCVPVSPHCSRCKLEPYCEKNDVTRSR